VKYHEQGRSAAWRLPMVSTAHIAHEHQPGSKQLPCSAGCNGDHVSAHKEKPNAGEQSTADHAARVHRWVVRGLRTTMALGFLLAIYEQLWLNALAILGILALMFVPALLGLRFRMHIPSEFEVLALVFVYAALFLGEVRGYYHRYWWWDLALHTSSGLLLGILGFLLVYVLNETEHIDLHMQPRFVAMFAFLFAVAIGVLWEIFEFAMDQLFATNMQKPMFDDPSGLTDTMWDLIVDTLGALIISVFGWWYMKRDQRSFFELWIRKFIARNPHLFGR
jgi:hypothetical protein